MTGRGHLASGTVLAADGIFIAKLVRDGCATAPTGALASFFWTLMRPAGFPEGIAWTAVAGIACAVCYYWGLLLPDIDLKGSTASMVLHLTFPGPHRGFPHSLWAVALVLIPGIFLPGAWRAPFRWLALGMLVHDIADAPSTAGWVPFYPFGKWREYKGTVMTRRWGHKGIYSSSNPGSEEAVNGLIIVISIGLSAFRAYLAYWPKG